jgi:hypothetical protein
MGSAALGTAKTTTAAALGVLLSRIRTPVQRVDIEPQPDISRTIGQNRKRKGIASGYRRPISTAGPGCLPLSIEQLRPVTSSRGRHDFPLNSP